MVTTHGGEVLDGEYRERWQHGGMWLQGSVAYNPNGGLSATQNQWYASLFGSGRIPVSNDWTTGFDAQLTSNDTYLKRYDISQLDRLVNDLFVEGDRRPHPLRRHRLFLPGPARHATTARSFPWRCRWSSSAYIPLNHWLGGQFRFDLNSVSLTRDIGVDNQRATAEARMRWPTILPGGQLLTLQLDARGDLYHVEQSAAARAADRQVHLARHSLCRARLALAVHLQRRAPDTP